MANIITLGSLIDKTVEHYRTHFKELVGITLWLIVGATPFLFSGYIAPAGVDIATPVAETLAYLIINIIGFISTTVVSLWIAACLMLTIDSRAKGNTPDHVALGKKSWKYILSLLVLSTGIAAAIITIIFFGLIPGILVLMFNSAQGGAGVAIGIAGIFLLFGGALFALYIGIRYSIELAFAQYVLVLENPNPTFKLRTLWHATLTSHGNVKGKWWAVAIRLFVPSAIISLIVIGITLAVNIISTVILSFAAASLSALAIKLIAIALTLSVFVINALVMPLYSLVTYYLYDSIRKS